MYKRKLHEALEVKKLKTINEADKTFQILKRDNGDITSPRTAGNCFSRK